MKNISKIALLVAAFSMKGAFAASSSEEHYYPESFVRSILGQNSTLQNKFNTQKPYAIQENRALPLSRIRASATGEERGDLMQHLQAAQEAQANLERQLREARDQAREAQDQAREAQHILETQAALEIQTRSSVDENALLGAFIKKTFSKTHFSDDETVAQMLKKIIDKNAKRSVKTATSMLNEQIRNLTDANAQLTDAQVAQTAQVEGLQQQLRALTEDNNARTDQVEELQQQLRALTEDNNARTAQVEELNEQIRNLTEDNNALTAQVENLQQQIDLERTRGMQELDLSSDEDDSSSEQEQQEIDQNNVEPSDDQEHQEIDQNNVEPSDDQEHQEIDQNNVGPSDDQEHQEIDQNNVGPSDDREAGNQNLLGKLDVSSSEDETDLSPSN